jgi:hypothetical protein
MRANTFVGRVAHSHVDGGVGGEYSRISVLSCARLLVPDLVDAR